MQAVGVRGATGSSWTCWTCPQHVKPDATVRTNLLHPWRRDRPLIPGRTGYPFALTEFGVIPTIKMYPPMAPVAPKVPIHPAVSLLGRIGNTPLLRLAKVDQDIPGVEIYGKAEFFNPGGSVKDRAGMNMILEGQRDGRLTKNRILRDATSGNTGIAYA